MQAILEFIPALLIRQPMPNATRRDMSSANQMTTMKTHFAGFQVLSRVTQAT
jgi:hypothetical protein